MAENKSWDASTSPDIAARQNEDDVPVFDLDVALVRLGGSVELLQQLAVLYSEDAKRLLDELREGAARQDVEQVKRAAHTLKGLAANFEATPAAQAAYRVERLADANDLDAAVMELPKMESQFERLQQALDRQMTSAS